MGFKRQLLTNVMFEPSDQKPTGNYRKLIEEIREEFKGTKKAIGNMV